MLEVKEIEVKYNELKEVYDLVMATANHQTLHRDRVEFKWGLTEEIQEMLKSKGYRIEKGGTNPNFPCKMTVYFE